MEKLFKFEALYTKKISVSVGRVIIKLNILTSICSICEIRGRSVDEIDFETAQSSSYWGRPRQAFTF